MQRRKNLTGDVLIVPLERKLATEIVDLHAAALIELPLEKLDGQRVLDPLLDHPLQRPGAIGRVVTFDAHHSDCNTLYLILM